MGVVSQPAEMACGWGEESVRFIVDTPCLQLDVIWAGRERMKGLARWWFTNGYLHDGRS